MIRIFFGQRKCFADCVACWTGIGNDTIACINSASQFNILEANKVKGLLVLNKTHQPFSFMPPPNSIALHREIRMLVHRQSNLLHATISQTK